VVLILQLSWVDLLQDCDVFSVDNPDIPCSFVEVGKIVIKGTIVAHLSKMDARNTMDTRGTPE
jgi:hypothetical protein